MKCYKSFEILLKRYTFLIHYSVRLVRLWLLGACCCGRRSIDIVVVDAEHLRQALVAIVYVARVHLIEHEVLALVVLLPQLRLQLVKVDRKVLTCTILGLFFLELVCTLALSVLDAPLARFAFRPGSMTMGPVTQGGGTASVGLPVGAYVPPSRHATSKPSIRGCTAGIVLRWGMLKLVVVDASICINVEMALIMATIGHLILEPVQLLIAQILILLVVDWLGSFSDLLDISLGLFSQVVCLLKFEENLSLQVHG